MIELYHDAGATQKITSGNPDTARESVELGDTFQDVKQIYAKTSNTDFIYEDNAITSVENKPSGAPDVTVEYSLDGNTWSGILSLNDGDYITPVAIWRRVTSTNVTQPFKRTDIRHRVTGKAFVE